MREPPHDELIRPMGTFTVFCSSRAKKKQAAENSGSVAGDALCHGTTLATSSSKAGLLTSSSASMRIESFAGREISERESSERWTCRTMLDWPEQSQTSPTRMSLDFADAPPSVRTASTCG